MLNTYVPKRVFATVATLVLLLICLIAAPLSAHAQDSLAEDSYNPATNVFCTTYSPTKTFDAKALLAKTGTPFNFSAAYTISVDFANPTLAAADGLIQSDYVMQIIPDKIMIQGATTKETNAALAVSIKDSMGVEVVAFTMEVETAKVAFRESCPTIAYGTDFCAEINDDLDTYLFLNNGETDLADKVSSDTLFSYGSIYTSADTYPDQGSRISVLDPANTDAGEALLLLAAHLDDNYTFDATGISKAPMLAEVAVYTDYTTPGAPDDQGIYWVSATPASLETGNTNVEALIDDNAPLHYNGVDESAGWAAPIDIVADQSQKVQFYNTQTGQLYQSADISVRLDNLAPEASSATDVSFLSATQYFSIGENNQTKLFVGSDGTATLQIGEIGSGIKQAHVTYEGTELDVSFEQSANNPNVWDISFALPVSQTAYDTHKIEFWADDIAGNLGYHNTLWSFLTKNASGLTQHVDWVIVTNERPGVEVAYDASDVHNAIYFNSGKQAMVTLSDKFGVVDDDVAVVNVIYTTAEGISTKTTLIGSDFSKTDPVTGLRSYQVDCTQDGMYEFVQAEVASGSFEQFTPVLQAPLLPNPFVVDSAAPSLDSFTWNDLVSRFNEYGVYDSYEASGLQFVINDIGAKAGLDYWSIDYGAPRLAAGSSQTAPFTCETKLPADDRFVSLSDIHIVACDMAGNILDISLADWYNAGRPEDGHPQGFVVDSAAPVFQLNFDNYQDYVPGYFNAERTATLTLIEASFGAAREADENMVVASRTFNESTIEYRAKDFQNPSGDNRTWELVVPCDDDGKYSIQAKWTDIALKSTEISSGAFVVDKQAPTIQVVWDNNAAGTGAYYNAPRTATITVRDANITPDQEITLTSTAADTSGAAVGAPGITGWTQAENGAWTTTLTAASELHYTLNITARDMAGNDAQAYESGEFVIDLTAPTVRIDRVEDRTAYADVVAPLVYFEDANFPDYAATVTVNGATKGSTYFSNKQESQTQTSKTIDYADLDHILKNDDIYTLTAKATDRAGNETTITKVFSVNRFGSNYILSEPTERALGTYLNKPQEVQVTEINVSGLVGDNSVVRIAQNANVRQLSTDEYATWKNPDAAWAEYVYTIPASAFAGDAYYRVLLNSRDTADNVSENLMNNKNADRTGAAFVEFAVDTTAPLANVFDLQPNTAYYTPSRSVDIDMIDNMKIDNATFSVDNQQTMQWGTDELGQTHTTKVDIAAKDTAQNIALSVTDAAGNSTTKRIDNVIITNNIFVYWLNTPALFYGTIIPTILILAALTALIILKRRKYFAEKAKVQAEQAAAGQGVSC